MRILIVLSSIGRQFNCVMSEPYFTDETRIGYVSHCNGWCQPTATLLARNRSWLLASKHQGNCRELCSYFYVTIRGARIAWRFRVNLAFIMLALDLKLQTCNPGGGDCKKVSGQVRSNRQKLSPSGEDVWHMCHNVMLLHFYYMLSNYIVPMYCNNIT